MFIAARVDGIRSPESHIEIEVRVGFDQFAHIVGAIHRAPILVADLSKVALDDLCLGVFL